VDSKQALRRATQQARATAEASRDFLGALGGLLEGSVAAYVPLPSEPGLAPRLGWLLPVLLPDGDLDWVAYDGRLVTGRFGLAEPVGPRLGVDAVAGCDVVLVPALLVDLAGNRLGKGGGSYDRVLVRATGLTVALVGDDELVAALPTEPHDVPVRAVATPLRGLVHLPSKM
jgi:5-formyltetrahydrofolate cyclo-ligase